MISSTPGHSIPDHPVVRRSAPGRQRGQRTGGRAGRHRGDGAPDPFRQGGGQRPPLRQLLPAQAVEDEQDDL